ncbi:Uncharacterised protein [Mycobacteroides abscessus subsp. abscessus]|nr:Uncharacterised protein [Mycobacteroides abscessus subsp. abscessus]
MPSAYTSNGTGRCCQRKLPPSLFTRLATGPIARIAYGLALMSAAESSDVDSLLRRMPRDWTACDSTLSGFWMSGPDCNTRFLWRNCDFSLRSSRDFA